MRRVAVEQHQFKLFILGLTLRINSSLKWTLKEAMSIDMVLDEEMSVLLWFNDGTNLHWYR